MEASSNSSKVDSRIQNADALANASPYSAPTKKKERWWKEECNLLTTFMNEGKSFEYITDHIGRTEVDCRKKWSKRNSSGWYAQQLPPAVPAAQAVPFSKSLWSRQEDELLVSLRMGGENWKEISARLRRPWRAWCCYFYRMHPNLVQELERQGLDDGEEEEEEEEGEGEGEGDVADGFNEEETMGDEDTGREGMTDVGVTDNEADAEAEAEGVIDEGEVEDWWKEFIHYH